MSFCLSARSSVSWVFGYDLKLLSLCSNYREITLLSIPGKVFNRVLLNRLKDAVDPHLRDNQARFRKTISCADHIVALRMEQSLEWHSPLYVSFIANAQVFGSVDRECIWKLLNTTEYLKR